MFLEQNALSLSRRWLLKTSPGVHNSVSPYHYQLVPDPRHSAPCLKKSLTMPRRVNFYHTKYSHFQTLWVHLSILPRILQPFYRGKKFCSLQGPYLPRIHVSRPKCMVILAHFSQAQKLSQDTQMLQRWTGAIQPRMPLWYLTKFSENSAFDLLDWVATHFFSGQHLP